MSSHSPDAIFQRVLVLAPFGRDAELLTRVLGQAQIKAERVADVEQLCDGIKTGVGSVLIAYEALTKEAMRVFEERMQTQEPWSRLPIFVMTHRSETEGRLLLKKLEPLGNVTILERPLRAETLVSTFRMGLRARAHQYQLRNLLDSERRGAKALRDSEGRYRKLAEALPLLVWTCRADGECDYLSRQWVEYTGIPEPEQLGFGWLQCIHPEDRTDTEKAWRNAYQTGAQYDIEYRLKRSDGAYRWFKTCGVPMKDSDGEVQKWFGSCTDIEDQKRVSEERRELLVSERKARELAELLNRVGPMLLQELDTRRLSQKVIDLATQLTGAEFGAMFNYAPGQEAEQSALYALSGEWPSGGEIPAPDFRGQGTVVSDDINLDHRFEQGKTQSRPRVKSYLSAPVTSRSGEVLGGLLFVSSEAGVFKELHVQLAAGIAAQAAIALDNARLFSEAQKSQETLKRSNTELRRANEDLNQFAYSASHDLQEPLRMVALYSQMLQRNYGSVLEGSGKEYLHYLVQGARRMEMLLRDLLDYTQVVADGEERTESCDANLVLQTTKENLKRAIADTGAEVHASHLPVLAVKQVHLLQLLQNLLGNALKYRSPDQPRVCISAQPEGKMWRLSVRDNGLGIAPPYKQQVFGLFKRLHGNNQYEGTGIGLAICQKIVDRYGGRIWVESEGEGKGSEFLFTLPGVNGVGKDN